MLSIIPYLNDIVNNKYNLRIVLASGSPRRKEILESLFNNSHCSVPFDIIVSSFAEDLDKSLFPHKQDYVLETARKKTLAVSDLISKDYINRASENKDGENGESKRIKSDNADDNQRFNKFPNHTLIIGSDTIVVKDETILEKPKDPNHAKTMMKILSGSTHQVFSAVIMISVLFDDVNNKVTNEEIFAFTTCTKVSFDDVDEDNIQAYIDTGEPFDKAGGYGIQGIAKHFIRSIDGCYYNVMGFPAHDFSKQFAKYINQIKKY